MITIKSHVPADHRNSQLSKVIKETCGPWVAEYTLFRYFDKASLGLIVIKNQQTPSATY